MVYSERSVNGNIIELAPSQIETAIFRYTWTVIQLEQFAPFRLNSIEHCRLSRRSCPASISGPLSLHPSSLVSRSRRRRPFDWSLTASVGRQTYVPGRLSTMRLPWSRTDPRPGPSVRQSSSLAQSTVARMWRRLVSSSATMWWHSGQQHWPVCDQPCNHRIMFGRQSLLGSWIVLPGSWSWTKTNITQLNTFLFWGEW